MIKMLLLMMMVKGNVWDFGDDDEKEDGDDDYDDNGGDADEIDYLFARNI